MARLAVEQSTVAAFNIMLASRPNQTNPVFTDEEIADVMQAMAESDTVEPAEPVFRPARWHWSPIAKT